MKLEVVPVTCTPHPTADTLSIVTGEGFRCVVKATWFSRDGGCDRGVYFPPGTQFPNTDVWNPILGKYRGKVRRIKLRGVVSEGLFICLGPFYTLGQDVTADYYGVLPPPPVRDSSSPGKILLPPIPTRRGWKPPRLGKVSPFAPGEGVVVTEQLLGRFMRFGWIGNTFYCGSRRRWFCEASTNLYWKTAYELDLPDKLRGTPMIFHGTLQTSAPGKLSSQPPKNLFYVQDIEVGGKYLDWWQLLRASAKHGVLLAPILYRGKYSELLLQHAGGNSVLDSSIKRRGILIRTEVEQRLSPRISRKVIACSAPI